MDINVGLGWKPLVDCIKTVALLQGVTLFQVKEKFGQLRVYHNGDKRFEDFINGMESISLSCCEECGLPAKAVGVNGWIKARCSSHRPPVPAQPPKQSTVEEYVGSTPTGGPIE